MTAAVEAAPAPTARVRRPLDPVTVEVIRRRLVAIADEVDVNITRTAFSPYIYEYKDYAVGIVDANGDLICQCTAGMPVFVADVMRAAVQDGLELYGPDELHDGDIIITNYAGTIGQHLNNVTMYTPIYAPQEPVLIGFMVVVMHWIDVGGRDIGSTVQIRHRHLPGRHPVPHREAALARRAGARNVPDDRAQHPLPGRDDGRHQLADRRLPDGARQRRRAGRTLRHRHVPRRARHHLGSVRGGGARGDPRHPRRHLHGRGHARQRRAQSRLAALQGHGDRRGRRDDDRPLGARRARSARR